MYHILLQLTYVYDFQLKEAFHRQHQQQEAFHHQHHQQQEAFHHRQQEEHQHHQQQEAFHNQQEAFHHQQEAFHHPVQFRQFVHHQSLQLQVHQILHQYL